MILLLVLPELIHAASLVGESTTREDPRWSHSHVREVMTMITGNPGFSQKVYFTRLASKHGDLREKVQKGESRTWHTPLT